MGWKRLELEQKEQAGLWGLISSTLTFMHEWHEAWGSRGTLWEQEVAGMGREVLGSGTYNIRLKLQAKTF